jgi:hypothetical protein
MPVENIVVISAVILAFATFGAVLAWADIRTRPASK